MGILIRALLAVMGVQNIHAINCLRTLLVSVANATALATFTLAKAIIWPIALLVVVGASLGGYGGAYYAERMNPERVRRFVIAVGLAMPLYFLIRH